MVRIPRRAGDGFRLRTNLRVFAAQPLLYASTFEKMHEPKEREPQLTLRPPECRNGPGQDRRSPCALYRRTLTMIIPRASSASREDFAPSWPIAEGRSLT
jgi:hypothetical protein